MTTQAIVPCLWLDDQAEEAGELYSRLFPASRIVATSRYPASGDNPAGRPPGSVLTVEVEIAGQPFTLLNGGPMFKVNPTVSFFVQLDDEDEARRLFAALLEGGTAMMPLGSYPWSPLYGWVADRFGVSWQVITGAPSTSGATIVPCLMFAGEQSGRAEEAMKAYTGIFPGGRIDRIERYAEGEGPVDLVKHGRFVLGGQEMVAMDSHLAHGVTFDEGVSLQVLCRDQATVDRYWEALSAGGSTGPCGWLEDRFGLSWQVVPEAIRDWLTSPDPAARDRAFAAMMGMTKPDVAALEAALAG